MYTKRRRTLKKTERYINPLWQNKPYLIIFFEKVRNLELRRTLRHVFKRFEMLVKANKALYKFFRNVKKYVSNKQRLLQKCPSAQQKYQKNQKYGQIFFKSCIQKCIRDVKQRSYIKFFNFRSKSCKPNSPLWPFHPGNQICANLL